MTARSLAAAVLLCATGCSRLDDVLDGLSHFVDVGKLVDDTAFLPLEEGRRTPDSGGMTDVGTGVTAVEITFIDELDPASIAGFSVEANLEFEGVAPHPSFPPFFNVEPIGRVRPHQVLTIPLATPLPESACTDLLPACHSTLRVFHVRLLSRTDGNPLRTIGAATPFIGTFDIPFRVIARDGARPFVSKLVTGAGTVEALTPEEVLAGAIEVGFLEPHSALRIEFSEEMREGVPVLIGPVVPVEETRTIGSRELRFFRPVTPGLSFLESVVTPPTGAAYTVLTTPAGQVHSLGQEYHVRIPSDSTLALQTTVAQDLSGEALGPFVPGLPLASIDYTAVVHFSHVVIDVPLPNSFVSGPMLDAGPVEVLGQVRPELAGDVTVTVLDPEGDSFGPFTADPTGLVGQTPHGRPTAQWRAQIPASTFEGQDGRYTIRADAVAFGSDSVTIEVDTTPPQLLGAFGSVDLYANDSDGLDRVCIAVGSSIPPLGGRRNDAARAELVLPDGTVVEANSPETFEDDDGRNRFGFCWVDVDLGSSLAVGRTNLTVRLYDDAGNVGVESLEIRVHPWLDSVTPDVVHLSTGTTNPVTLRGAGLKTFSSLAGDAVRVDARDVVGGTVVAEFVTPIRFRIEAVLPDSLSPGAISVRIDGLESNRLRFEVCRPEPPKFVTERQFARYREDVIGDLDVSRSEFAMERGPQGEPVFAWASDGQLVIASPDLTGQFAETLIAVPGLRSGDLVEFWRKSDGALVPFWVSTGSGNEITSNEKKYGSAAPATGKPEWLAMSTDPATGLPLALVVTRRSVAGEPQAWAQLFRMSLLGPTVEVSEQINFHGNGSFSGGLATSPDGRGWMLVGADKTYQWRRGTNGVWNRLESTLPGFVSDAVFGPDGWFHAVTYGDEGAGLGENTVPAALRYYRASQSASAWTLEWTREIEARPSAFRPPPVTKAPQDPARLLAASATVRVTADGIPVIAYMDANLKSVRLQRLFPVGGDVGMVPLPDFDVDVATGHMIELVLDGNGAALVSYADLSMAEAPPDPDDLGPGAPVEERLSASILLTDTRTNVQPRPGEHAGPSRCSDRYESEYISSANLAEIGRRQADRFHFAFGELATAFCVGQSLTDRARGLCEAQGSAALSSRLLENGTFTFRGGVPDFAGDAVDGTVTTAPVHVRSDENSGVRVPVGYKGYSSAQIHTGDPELGDFHIANFNPRTRSSACDGKNEASGGAEAQPVARDGAAMTYAPSARKLVLFGGRDKDGNALSDTWTLDSGEQCWKRVEYPVGSVHPPRQSGHVMATAPFGEGVLLVGRGSTYLFDLKNFADGEWVKLTTIGAPQPRTDAAVAVDPDTQKVWLLGGRNGTTHLDDLWSFEAVPAGAAFDYVWTFEGLGPPSDNAGGLERFGAGLVVAPKVQGGVSEDLFVFGGRDGGTTPRNDLWRRPLSGGAWISISENNPNGFHNSDDPSFVFLVPQAREGMSALYAPEWGRLVVFGGATMTRGFIASASELAGNTMDALRVDGSGTDWEFVDETALPIPRQGHAWAVETTAQGERRLVVFGGTDGTKLLDDTSAFSFTPSQLGFTSGIWKSVIPPNTNHVDGIALGRRGTEVVQWGRNDLASLFASSGAADLLEGFAGGAFPPLGNSPSAAIRFRFDHYRLGPGKFTRFMDSEDGASGEQGTFRNRFQLSRVFAEGEIIVAGEAFIGEIEIDSDIPILGLPIPELGCSLLLNAPLTFPDPIVTSKPIVIDADVQLAIDDRGPRDPEETFTKFSGVVVSEDVDADIPLCVLVRAGDSGPPLGAADLLTFVGSRAGFTGAVEDVVVSMVTRQLGLDRLGVSIEAPKGILGSLGPLAGARAVDAFTFVDGQHPEKDLRELRTGPFFAIKRGISEIQQPQWILLDDGLTVSARTDGVFLPPLVPPLSPLAQAP